jgi:hypothetical protein
MASRITFPCGSIVMMTPASRNASLATHNTGASIIFRKSPSASMYITYSQVEIRPYVVFSPDKVGVPQPKLAYRLDCHNVMHKKLSQESF